MASHKTVTTHRASKKTITASRTAVTLATATVGSIALVPGLAHADPSETVKDVQNKIKDLQEQAEVITEQYNASNAQLADLQHKVDHPPFPKNVLIQTVTDYIPCPFTQDKRFVYGNTGTFRDETKSIMD